jgi:hypothetical protein
MTANMKTPRDDLFWRTFGSGGRATRRSRTSGKSTSGAHGDITYTDPLGKPLCDLWTIEAKRYKEVDLLQSIDGKGKKPTLLESFLIQANEANEARGIGLVCKPLLILQRNCRESVVFFPWEITGGVFKGVPPCRLVLTTPAVNKRPRWVCVALDDFLEIMSDWRDEVMEGVK